MFKIKFAKKLILTFLSGLIFMLALFFVLNGVYNNNKQNSATGADLTISTFEELKNFADSAYMFNDLDHSYTGKVVVLGADIDCGGEELTIGLQRIPNGPACAPIFNGIFDGQGHTISNFCLTDSMTIVTMTAGGYSSFTKATGMFLHLGPTARVRNLKISNVTCSLTGAGGYGGITLYRNAGIVGYMDAGAQVYSCAVENMSGGCGIVASGAGSVVNCYVNNASSAGIGPVSATHSMATSSLTNTTSISNCVVKNCPSISALSTTNCYSESLNTYSGLSISAVGGSGGKQWYRSADYNDGFPLLRQFISDWKTVRFVSSNADYGKVSLSSIQIPIDANKTYASNSPVIAVYDQSVIATEGEGCYFKGWTYSSNTYTATFDAEIYNLSFTILNENGSVISDGLNQPLVLSVKRNDVFIFAVYYSEESTIIKINNSKVCETNPKYEFKSYVFNGKEVQANNSGYVVIPDMGDRNKIYTVQIKLAIKTYIVEHK